MKNYNKVLLDYLPDKSVPTIAKWLENTNIQLRITRSRFSKLGDYRPPVNKNYHRISINHDLNKFHFLITLIHEFAHLKVWEEHRNYVKPHGIEWKNFYSILMQDFLSDDIFPPDILSVLKQYLKNPSASTSNSRLLAVLRNYDADNQYPILEDLPANSIFRIENGFLFQKIEKLRKRIKCKRLDNNRIYLVNPMIKVELVKN
jgi:hypothetical protein